MTDSLTSDDARYRELFDVAKESFEANGRVEGDLTPAMNALRDKAPAMKGCLRELLGIPEGHKQYVRDRAHYTLFSFEACERAFRENLIFSSEVYQESPGVQRMGRTILEMVGDEHRRHRSVVQPMFLRPKAQNWWQQNWIEESIDALLDRFDGWEGADLNTELCARLPVHVISRGMGLQGEDALSFREHLMRSTVHGFVSSDAERQHSAREVERMLTELITARRAEPGDDVVSGLIARGLPLADGSSRPLSDQEIFGYCRLIMVAGGGTTWRQLGITLHALLNDYRYWEAVRDDRSLVEKAIEEAARWMPTDPTFPRLLTQDVEIGGVRIEAGARVDLCLGSANRDPARWDDPDSFNPLRRYQYHLGFALGPHMCLGKNVAVQEMMTAINGLMDRFPTMRLDPDAPAAEVQGGLHQRGMSHVKVCFR